MQERGVEVDHSTINRWVLKYAPELDKRIRPHLQPANDLWKVDETYSSRTRQKFVAGVEFALSEAPRSGGKRKIDGKAEAFLVATVCSDPPQD